MRRPRCRGSPPAPPRSAWCDLLPARRLAALVAAGHVGHADRPELDEPDHHFRNDDAERDPRDGRHAARDRRASRAAAGRCTTPKCPTATSWSASKIPPTPRSSSPRSPSKAAASRLDVISIHSFDATSVGVVCLSLALVSFIGVCADAGPGFRQSQAGDRHARPERIDSRRWPPGRRGVAEGDADHRLHPEGAGRGRGADRSDGRAHRVRR